MVKPIPVVAAVVAVLATTRAVSNGAVRTAAMAAAALSSYVAGIAFAALR